MTSRSDSIKIYSQHVLDPMFDLPDQIPEAQPEYRLVCPRLPLAVYREVEAHLYQVDGVEAGLLPQRSSEFDYLESQVGGLWIRYNAEADEASQRRVEQILAYYGDRYGNWELFK